MKKRIAIPCMGKNVCQHFGRAQIFEVLEIIDGHIVKTEVISIDNSKYQHKGIVLLLKNQHIDTVICDWIGAPAIQELKNAGLEVLQGVRGNIQEIVQAYIDGTLIASTEICDRSSRYTYNIECLCDYSGSTSS